MNIDELKKTVLEELGINEFPVEAQEEIINKLSENILKSITIEAISKLTPEQQAELENIEKNGDAEQAMNYITSNIENFEEMSNEVAAEEINEFKKIMSGM